MMDSKEVSASMMAGAGSVWIGCPCQMVPCRRLLPKNLNAEIDDGDDDDGGDGGDGGNKAVGSRPEGNTAAGSKAADSMAAHRRKIVRPELPLRLGKRRSLQPGPALRLKP